MIEYQPQASAHRERLAEEIHEFLWNEKGYPEQDVLSQANADGVVVEGKKNAGRDDAQQ